MYAIRWFRLCGSARVEVRRMIASCQQNDQCVRADRYAERNFSYGEKCGEDTQQATRGFTAEQ